jgi:hypothetical protein
MTTYARPTTARATRSWPEGRRAVAAIGLVVAALVAIIALRPPATTAVGVREQASVNGTYRASFTSSDDPITIGRLHSWTLRVTTARGEPVTDARIEIHGDMPAHGHGMPTKPAVTRHLGNGAYLVEGMSFQMGGHWVIDFDIESGGQRDRVSFELELNG